MKEKNNLYDEVFDAVVELSKAFYEDPTYLTTWKILIVRSVCKEIKKQGYTFNAIDEGVNNFLNQLIEENKKYYDRSSKTNE